MDVRFLASSMTLLATLGCSPRSKDADTSGSDDIRAEFLADSLHSVGFIGDSLTFGQVTDLVLDDSGNVYVLDALNGTIRGFTSEWHAADSTGHRGKGPGEFGYASRLMLNGDSALLVLDRSNLRLSEYAAHDGKVEWRRDIPLTFPANDACVLGRSVVLMGLYDDATLHELSDSGTITRSFAPPPEGTTVPDFAAAGFVRCDATSRTVVEMPGTMATVRAFRGSGEMIWRHELTGYHPIVYEIGSGGTVTPKFDSTGMAHSAMSMFILDDSTLVIQLEVARRGQVPGSRQETDTRLLDLRTGQELGVSRELPRLVRVEDTLFFAAVTDPYPRVNVLTFGSR